MDSFFHALDVVFVPGPKPEEMLRPSILIAAAIALAVILIKIFKKRK